MLKRHFPLLVVLFDLLFPLQLNLPAQDKAVRQEESEDYFAKWLNEDVVYIITNDERSVFENLTTPEEKERFIEQFWYRRDPDPATSENEFKIEHYRRIAYANDHFTSGYEGWRTDRGRIYIIHGPPAEIESHPSAGAYNRPMNEGGGNTAAYPFEVWTYRHIDGVGDDITLEFVDRSLSGDYRLALQPEEKDALLYVPGAGLTAAEELGIARKADRPFFNPLTHDYPMMEKGARDNPFYRYEIYTSTQAPTQIKYRDLRELVDVRVSFNSLPFKIRTDFFRLNAEKVLVPITIQVENKELTFQTEENRSIARAAVYGLVSSLGNRRVTEFDHELISLYPADEMQRGIIEESVYQKVIILSSGRRYKLDVVVKDLESGKTGVVRRALVTPSTEQGQLACSSVILANSIRVLEEVPSREEMFVIGDVKVLPNIRQSFSKDQLVGLYFQVYNAALDQASFRPSLKLSFLLMKDGQVLRQMTDRTGQSIQYFSDDRIVVAQALGLEGLESSRYTIRIQVEDQLKKQSVELNVPFTLAEGG